MTSNSLSTKTHYDIAIIGGGMVGSAAAVGLARRGFSVALVESYEPKAFVADQAADLRVSAINLASKELFEKLDVWNDIEAMRLHPYQRIAVWESGSRCEFDAADLNIPHLGYFIENRLIQLACLNQNHTLDNLDVFYDADLEIANTHSLCQLRLSNGIELQSDWLIAADGVNSKTRQHVGIGTQGWKYAQQVLAVGVKMNCGDFDTSWQQFTPSGPMAFLPMFDHHAALIWYNDSQEIERLKALNHAALKDVIQRSFPDDLGEFSIEQTASFPIQRLHAKRYHKHDVLLIGDAAHSINPLAGQGVNLGFKDLDVLLALIDKLGAPRSKSERRRLFRQYERKRRYDNLLMMSSMDGFYAIFSNNFLPLKLTRNIGLNLADKLSPLKRQVLKYAVGLNEAY